MAELPDYDALTDELVVQEVILDSLQTETFDGVEQERHEAKREIDRLRALLSQQPRPAQFPAGDRNGDGGRYHRPRRLRSALTR